MSLAFSKSSLSSTTRPLPYDLWIARQSSAGKDRFNAVSSVVVIVQSGEFFNMRYGMGWTDCA
jgi:hypothetical protein